MENVKTYLIQKMKEMNDKCRVSAYLFNDKNWYRSHRSWKLGDLRDCAREANYKVSNQLLDEMVNEGLLIRSKRTKTGSYDYCVVENEVFDRDYLISHLKQSYKASKLTMPNYEEIVTRSEEEAKACGFSLYNN